jgi:hypothetical protein
LEPRTARPGLCRKDQVINHASTFSPLCLAYTLSRIDVAESALLEDAVLVLNGLSRSRTNCTAWDAAFASFDSVGEEVFKSLCTVAKAD